MQTGERILIVEDNEDVVTFLADNILHPHGYDTLVSRDGQDGLRRALEENPDLILLDLNLPRMTGMEVLKVLQKRGSNIPVILMTFYGSEEIAVDAFRLGVKNYIVKPFKSQEVLDAVDAAVGEGRLRREKELLTEQLMQTNKLLEQRVRDLTMLYEITQAMTKLVDLETLLSRLVEAAVFLSKADEGILFLLDEETGELYPRAAKGVGEKYAQDLRMRLEESLIGQVVETGDPLRVTSPEERLELKVKTGYLVSSLLYVPLKLRDEIKGVLGVSNRVSDSAFTAADQHRLNILADYAVIALENARLGEEEQSKAHRLAMASHVSHRITSILDVDALLSNVVELLNEKLGYYYSQILLRNREAALVVREGTGDLGQQVKATNLTVHIDDQSIVGWAASHGEALCINNVRKDPRHQPQELLSRTQAELALPLRVGIRLIGVLDVHSDQTNAFGDDQENLLQMLADQVAIAVENATSSEQTTGSVDMTAVAQIGGALTSASTEDEVLTATMRAIADLLEVEEALLLLVREPGTDLVIKKSQSGAFDKADLPPLKVGQGISGWVVQRGDPLLVNEPSEDPRYDADLAKAGGLKARSIMCVPLKGYHRVRGAIELINKKIDGEEAKFDDHDLAKLKAIASMAALALENQRLESGAPTVKAIDQVRQTLFSLAQGTAQPLQSIAATTYALKASSQSGKISCSDDGLDQLLQSMELRLEQLASLHKLLKDLASSDGTAAELANFDRRLEMLRAKYPS
jgi:GAF domain-containing protein/CheY-like chemotaxis protein